MRSALTVALLLASCSTDPLDYDADGDGTPDYNDCAPNDASIHPGAEELCDGLDNNCNSSIDEIVTRPYYVDNDGDGHAGPTNTILTCDPTEDMYTTASDCNDQDGTVHPDAIEICDGVDNNCDNQVDPPFFEEDFTFVSGDTIEFNGSANDREGTDDNRYLELTGFTAQERGAAWFRTQVPGDVWEARFQMEVTREDGGEGLTFVFKPNERVRTLGGSGLNMGIYGEDEDGWVVEFDTINNPITNTDNGVAPHIAIATIRDKTYLQTENNPIDFRGNGYHAVQIRMDNGRLRVRMDGVEMLNRLIPDYDPTLLYTLGFTASTSVPHQQAHNIDDVLVQCPEDLIGGSSDTSDSATP